MKTTASGVTGVVLAGGLGRRMGGVDKGLTELDGRPMVEWVVERLLPQVEGLVINANQNADRYGRLGHRVVADLIPGFAGPLAGLHAGLQAASTELVATAPCDSPFLPDDLVERLRAALDAHGAQLSVARTFDQPHPVFCLVRRDVCEHLAAFLAAGGRKIDRWYGELRTVEVDFSDQAEAFRNINTPDELAQNARR